MAIADFIPNVWSARFTEILWRNRVYGAGTNRNYEGEIRMAGDTVKVPTATGRPTVRDYQVNTDIAVPELTDGTTADLSVDQQKYFNFFVDDIQRRQMVPDLMDATIEIAAQLIAETQDEYLMGVFSGAFASARSITSANGADATPQQIIESFIQLRRAMTEAHIPLEGRWCAMHPRIMEKIEQHFIAQGGSAAGVFAPATADGTVENGFAGRLLGFDLRVTTSVPTSGAGAARKYRLVASQGMAGVTMAEQIAQMEAYRPERRFGDGVKGLYVYGALAAEPQRIFYNELDDPTAS